MNYIPMQITDLQVLWNENIHLSYKGPFEETILITLGNYIKNNLNPGNRFFSIFIELAQNIAYYSADTTKIQNTKEPGTGMIMIGDFGEHYALITGNIIRNQDIIPLIEKCEIINSLDREGLRKFKREQLRLPRGAKGGAHIGLIQVALTSANPLEFSVHPIDENTTFFSLSVKLIKPVQDMPTEPEE